MSADSQRVEAIRSETVTTKVCGMCGQAKPLDDFYRRSSSMDGHAHRCKQCDNGRPRQTKNRILQTRARHRAYQDLVKAHRAEYRVLFEQRLTEAYEEADRVAASEAAQETFTEDETPRLKKGARALDEEAEDRVDTEWCADCVTYHQRGHKPCTTKLRDGRVVDLVVLEEFNAGVQRARMAR